MLCAPVRGRGFRVLGVLTALALLSLTALGAAAILRPFPPALAAPTDGGDVSSHEGALAVAEAADEQGEEVLPYVPDGEALAAGFDGRPGPVEWYRLPLWLQAWVLTGFAALTVLLGARSVRWFAYRGNGRS